MGKELKTKLFSIFVVGSSLSLISGGAFAAGMAAIDVADVVSTVGNQVTSIALVGAAVLGIIVCVKAYKWVRAALS